MDNKLIQVVIAITVGIVVLGSLLVPVINDASTTEKTFKNTGLYYVTDLDEDESYTYVFDGTKWTVNGETLNIASGGYNIIVTDEHFIRSNGQIDGSTSTASGTYTVTSEGISGTYVRNETDYTVSWNVDGFFGAISSEDAYIMTDPDQNTYVSSESMIVGFGVSSVAGGYPKFHITGNMNEVTVTSSDSSITIDNIKINKTAVEGYVDLYDFQSITFDATKNDTTSTVTYNRVIVPSEVTSELSEHLDTGEITILAVIPILIIVGLLLFVVRFFTGNRD